MEVGQHDRRGVGSESNSDLISLLPIELVENILVRLPIKEAIRTSVLSSRWKCAWTSIPHLVFEDDDLGYYDHTRRFRRLVDMVLSVHRGPILSFHLIDHLAECKEVIERWWVPFLSQNAIKDLRLHFGVYTGYEKKCIIPSSIFSCHKLENLEISDCILNAHDQCFQGFKFLRSLKLAYCDLIGVTTEKFVSSCSLLETLELYIFYEDRSGDCIVIRAPNLKKFILVGLFNKISLGTPNLTFVSIVLCSMLHRPMNNGGESELCRVLGRLPNIEELEVAGRFNVYLSSGHTPKKLPVTYYCLKKISIYMGSSSMKELQVALCIFRSAPNLKTLSIYLFSSQNIWEDQRITTEISFKHLEVVEIRYFADDVSMIGFAKFLLSTAPMLEKVIIDKRGIRYFEDNEQIFISKLRSLPKLSTKAVVLVDDFSNK